LGDSIVFHGRVSQQQLAQEWLKAGVWLYPTCFTETFGITAKEAQLSATPIVCSNIAALETTVGDYGIRVKSHPLTREARIEYVDHIIRLCSDQDLWNAFSQQAYKAQKERLSWPERWQDYWSKYLF
jgi:glycosyltransferase involved in cell wall biosynthesis